MDKVRAFLYRLGSSFRYAFAHMMEGRYGMDKMNIAILVAGLVVSVISSVLRGLVISMLLTVVSYGLMFWAIFRCMSRNTYRRYDENCRYLSLISRLKDREHCYFRCPKCRQMTRVPRGKGKIAISCPRCRERFVRKS